MWYGCYIKDAFTVTGELSVRYHESVPLETTLRAEGYMTQRRGRLCLVEGRILLPRGDEEPTLLASAKGKFVVVPEDQVVDPGITQVG